MRWVEEIEAQFFSVSGPKETCSDDQLRSDRTGTHGGLARPAAPPVKPEADRELEEEIQPNVAS